MTRKKSLHNKPRSSPDPGHHDFLKRLMEEVENKFYGDVWNFCETVTAVVEDGFHEMEGFTTVREWVIDRFGKEFWPVIQAHVKEMEKRRMEDRLNRYPSIPQPDLDPLPKRRRKRKSEARPQ